ncbi:methionine aminopeptidase [Elysia marginata]|uniref:Methionine aminopeptidase n=1 Tax=Elysia marginata TaxID=1093978 RepID=A0AAV4HME4_9GAST|nr:methionine aminopeptidase [Elysia marginata]
MASNPNVFSGVGSKRLLNFICKSSYFNSKSPLKTVHVKDGSFSTTSRQEVKRHFPSTIALPSYITSGQLNSPSVAEIKSDKQITQMSSACRMAASILQDVGKIIKVGITTNDIDDLVFTKCIEAGAYPSPLLYKGFPKSVCTSVNEVACHGIPSGQVLNEGDIINVDITFHTATINLIRRWVRKVQAGRISFEE